MSELPEWNWCWGKAERVRQLTEPWPSHSHTDSTAFGLYRDGTELRGVYYSKPEVARTACFSLGDQCDYPILMGQCKSL